MSFYSLYQDPMQSQPMVIPDTGIGMQLVPTSFTLSDPVFLRHVLCMMITVRNFFHVYLCWRQLRLCNWVEEPPSLMQSAIANDDFQVSKVVEMYAVEQKLMSYIFDAIFSCFELYFGVFPYLWKIIISCYSIVDDLIWQSIAFVGIFTTYMVLRELPQTFYNKLVLEPFYQVNKEKSMPLVGVLCTAALLVVLLQVFLIPLTTIFLFIEENGGQFFVLWIWGFLFFLSIVAFLVCNLYGIPIIGKKTKLPDGPLKNALADLLKLFKFPPDSIYVLRTFHISNATAFAWGFCSRKHVIIIENLLWNQGKPESELFEDEIGRGLKDNELVAFVAHELSHHHAHHRIKEFFMLHTTLLIYLVLFGTCYRIPVLYEAAGFSPTFYPPVVGYWLVYKYVMPLYLTITNWIIFYVLRHSEYAADKYAWKLGFGATLTTALLKLFSDNQIFPYVDHWYLMWHRIRPSSLQRIKHLNRLERHTKGF